MKIQLEQRLHITEDLLSPNIRSLWFYDAQFLWDLRKRITQKNRCCPSIKHEQQNKLKSRPGGPNEAQKT